MTALGRALGYVRTQTCVVSKDQSQVWQPHSEPHPASPHFSIKIPGVKRALFYPVTHFFYINTHTEKKNVFYKIFSMMHNKQNQKKYKNMKNKNHPLTYHLQMFTETLVQIFLVFFLLSSY